MSQLPRYESYKDSGVQWLGEIPSHWDVKQLKFAVTCNDEALGENTEPDYEILYVDISSVSLTDGIKHKEELSFKNAPSRARRIVKSGDVLVSTVRTYLKAITYVEFAEENLIASTGFAILRPSEKFDSKFIGYWIQSEGMVGNIVANSVGVSYPAINSTDLVRLPIVEAPLIEQKIIADFLDKRLAQVDALIAKQETLLEKLAEQRVALISHAVTKGLNPDVEMKESGVEWLGKVPNHWKTIRIKFLGDIVLGLTYSPEDVTTSERGTLVLRSSNVQKGMLALNDNVYVEKSIPKKMVTTDQDILICSRNGSRALIGKCALIEGEGVGQAFGAFMTVLRSPYRKYLYYVLSSGLFKYQIGSFLTSTINQLTTYALGNFEIAFPLEEEQKKITDYLDQELAEIEKVEDNVGKTLRALQEYRSTLITKVVTGKIDVRNLKVN